ncbi:transcription termination factor NusA [Microgenomates group bacterium]|nr:transcription termination factor NusA [Microgenomates group bacterium]
MKKKRSSNSEKLKKIARNEFAMAIAEIAIERKIDEAAIYEAIQQALAMAYRRQFEDSLDPDKHYLAVVEEVSGEFKILAADILAKDEETGEATSWDEKKMVDVTPAGFGRIAAQTAKQVILQRIRESERDQILAEYSSRVGEMITAQVLRMEGRDVLLDIGRGYGIMPPTEQMRGEFYKNNARLAVIVKEIAETKKGQQVIVSRADKALIAKLFEREVPEIAAGTVEIAYLAREAGVRAKLVVKANGEGIDPVGSAVGQRGVRVQEVIKELNSEKIDIIPYSEDMVELIKACLAPAENMQVVYDEGKKHAEVTVVDDQVSLAIGKGGQNVRLAAKVLGMAISIKSASGEVANMTTGEEEYEIDTYEGLERDTREALVQAKLTTLADLVRFKEKITQLENVSLSQQRLLLEKVTEELAREGEGKK